MCFLIHLIMSRSDISDSSTIPAVDNFIEEDSSPTIGYHFCDTTNSTNKHAVLTLAAPCALWTGNNDWFGADHPLKIIFGPKPSKTPIYRRLKHHEKKAKSQLRGHHRILPEHLNALLYMPILKGELQNENVSD